MKPHPPRTGGPRWADQLLKWFCAPHMLEEVQGDLYERYGRDVRVAGLRTANRRYWLNVLRFMRPFAIKRQPSDYSSPFFLGPDMLRNYWKIAWRSLAKNQLFTALNCIGLAIGLAVSLTLILYARDELVFDKYHRHADRIYRVNLTTLFDGKTEQWGNAPNVVGPTIMAQLPTVESQVRLLRHNFGQTAFVNSATQKLTETKLYWADSTLFDVFDVPLLLGNSATALNGPNQILLSQSAAKRYFGAANPLGKTLDVDNTLHLRVTGVYADFPNTSSLDANLIGSFASVKWASNPTNQSWSNASFETYLLLRPQTNVARLTQQMEAIVAKNVPKANRFYMLWLQSLPGRSLTFGQYHKYQHHTHG